MKKRRIFKRMKVVVDEEEGDLEDKEEEVSTNKVEQGAQLDEKHL